MNIMRSLSLFLFSVFLTQVHAQRISYPLMASSNRKYIVDVNSNPVFLKGCASWRIGYNVSVKEARTFLEDRKAKDFNAVIVQISPDSESGGDVPNIYGDHLFTGRDVSKPNENFFLHVDSLLQLCQEMNFAVILFPLYTGCCKDGWLEILQQKPNDLQKIFAYGKWVGNRYKKFSNIIWASGGDHNETPESLALAVGINEGDNTHLHMFHTWPGNTSIQRLPGAKWLSLSAAYTYFPAMDDNFTKNYHVYAQLYEESIRNKVMPYFMFESAYEYERNETTQFLRRQAYWSLLSGASGHFFGNRDTWRMNAKWREALNTPGSESMQIFHAFINGIDWHNLEPDWMGTCFVSGRGTFNGGTAPGGDDYATGAITGDGSLAILYIPTYRRVSINMRRFEDPVTIEWFDPTTGLYEDSKLELQTDDVVYVSPPSKYNKKGFEDWVLIVRRK